MSAEAALPAEAPKKNGRKKIILIALAVLLLVAAAAGFMVFRSYSAHAEEDDEVEVEVTKHTNAQHQPEAFDPKHAPVFVPLDAITINLADRDTDRYAQVVISLEVDEAKTVEQVKAFMPVIRSNLLLAIANKTSEEVRTDDGRRLLTAELHAQALRPLGYNLSAEDLVEGEAKPGAPKSKSRKPAKLPIKAVHFVNFIVQ